VLAQAIAPALRPGALVTDVGSVKGDLCRACVQALGEHGTFVGAHPMAGSEKTGHEHGTADLFERRTCFVTPLGGTAPEAVERCVRFWHGLGAETITLDPDRHDEIVAHISHLPHLLAALLCVSLAQRDPSWQLHAGNGLRDVTRIASGDPLLWRSIVAMNRHEILRAVNAFQDQLDVLRAALANGDDLTVRRLLETGRAWRATLPPR
jgi:prephenate dehydrogenase